MNNSHYSNIRETLPVSFVPPSPPSEATLSSAPLQKRTLEEKEAALKLQSFARGYLSRKQTKATKWVNNQKINPQDLLFKIVKKETPVPSNISLHLVLDSLINNGADVHATDDYERTPLHLALEYGHPEIVKVLIEKGADVNATDYYGKTPLPWAVRKGNLEMAKFLIEKGADVNAKNYHGNTPLYWASFKGYLEITQLLIEKGADVNVINKEGWTPLREALVEGYLEIAKLFIIVNHLDNNDSIDTLTSDIENLTTEEIKDYYNENKDQIESLMDKRTKSLIKKAITDLNEDISIAIIKRGKVFIKDLCEVRPLKELCAIELQKHFTKDDYDPYYNELKTYPDILQKIFFKSYTPLLTLSDEQITCAQKLKKLNS